MRDQGDEKQNRERRRRILLIGGVIGALSLAILLAVALESDTCDADAPTAYERQIICDYERSGGIPTCPAQLTAEQCEDILGTLGGEHPGGPSGQNPSPQPSN
jgi:hypothetical protein